MVPDSPPRLHRSLFGGFYNKMSHLMPSREQTKRSLPKKMSPQLASQLGDMWKESKFKEPQMQQITQAIQPFKRDAQNAGYSYLPPENPLRLPSEKLLVIARSFPL